MKIPSTSSANSSLRSSSHRAALSRSFAGGLAVTSALAIVLCALPARADDADNQGGADPGVARLSVLRGDVDLKRADSGDTVAAALNAPVSAGDYVTTRDNSRVEIQYGYGSAVRVAADTQLRFTHLDPDNHALQLAQGTVEMRVFRGLEAHPEVETPAATIRPDENGRYRITVTNDGNTEVTVRSGHADVITQSGTQTIAPEGTLLIEGTGNDVRFQTIDTVASDDFDAWNQERDAAFERDGNYKYVDQGIVGADDLDAYGHWVDQPDYGQVWAPDEPVGWAPYHDGRWVWEPFYGWTWVGDEPWGYAPYHYGNWFYADNAWFWYPGAYGYAPVYRPALVAFFSFGIGGGGFGVGFGNIGWLPLAPFEPFHPWWGPRGFGSRTTIVNNVTIRNVTINNYYNFRAPNSVAAVSNANFAAGNFNHLTALHGPELKTITALRGGVVPVVPTQHNLVLNPHANAPIASASAPLSSRFAAFHQSPVARPASFTAERGSVASAAQKLYPEHAAAFAHPEPVAATESHATTSATGRVATPAERDGTAPERSVVSEPNREVPSTQSPSGARDPWSRFGDNGAASNATRTNSSPARETAPLSTTPRTSRATSPSAESRPGAADDSSGSAWRRFGSTGSAGTGTASRPIGSGNSGARSYGSSSYGSQYGSSSSANGARRYGGPSVSSPGSSGSSYRAAPASRPAPAGHSAQTYPGYHSAPSGGSGGSASHAHASSSGSGGGSKSGDNDSKKGH